MGKILERVENAVGEAYKRMQFAGREVFKTDLQRGYEFWNRCDSAGARGKAIALRSGTSPPNSSSRTTRTPIYSSSK